jgi:hypothetical protein
MEFFEKELGAKFVDTETGESSIERIKAHRVCPNCEYISYGDGVYLHPDDMVCVCDKSEYCSDFRSKDDTCRLWTAKKKKTTEDKNGENPTA